MTAISTNRLRAWAALCGLAVHACGTLLLPFLHTIEHSRGHQHSHAHTRTGEAFFARAAARALAALAHERLHADGQRHDHEADHGHDGEDHAPHGPADPRHGESTAQHLGVAVLASTPVVAPSVHVRVLAVLPGQGHEGPPSTVRRLRAPARAPPA